MKISVAMVSRGRETAMSAVIMGLWRLKSGLHEVDFHIGVDTDDDETVAAGIRLQREVALTIHTGPRPIARGEVENSTLAHVKGCDVTTLMTDRTFCITPGWDDGLAKVAVEKPNRVLWWMCPHDPVCAIPIIPKAWLDACDWKWSPEIFPFWFDDTWNQHIDLLIHGMPSLKARVAYSGTRGITTRGRDFEFWINLFRETFPMRVRQARKMAATMGIEWKLNEEVAQYFENHHNALINGVAGLQSTFGDPSEPGPEYMEAFARAQKIMSELKVANTGIEA